MACVRTPSAVTNNHDGTFTTIFTGTAIGTNTITADIGTQAVTSTAPTITVTPIVVTITSGSGQSATVGTAFANALVATVTSGGSPLSVVSLSAFAGFASGPGVTFPNGSTATTNAQGQASVKVDANTIAGSDTVSASVAGPELFHRSRHRCHPCDGYQDLRQLHPHQYSRHSASVVANTLSGLPQRTR